jgi:hypothetical protein
MSHLTPSLSARLGPKRRAGGLLLAATISCPAMAAFTEIYTFPAGVACSFELKVEGDGSGVRVKREPTHGHYVAISAGTGEDLRLTNTSTGTSLTLQGNGAVQMTTRQPLPNGYTLIKLTGHNILFMYPTDTPPGPSSTLYAGQVNYSVDAQGNYTVLSSAGSKTDLCAALAS